MGITRKQRFSSQAVCRESLSERSGVTVECTLAEDETAGVVTGHVATLRSQVGAVRRAEPDGIHDMRVASRRLRAALNEFAPFFERKARVRFAKRIRSVTRRLGQARELDVTLGLLRDWRPDLADATAEAVEHLHEELYSQRIAAAPSIQRAAAGVESPDFEEALRALFENRPPATRCYREAGSLRLTRRLENLSGFHLKWVDSRREEALHRLRVRFKKLRYASETYAPLYGAALKPFIQRLKEAQGSLGQWNDQRILRNYALRIQEQAPSLLNPGFSLLVQSLDRRVSELERQFAGEAELFFSKAEQDNRLRVLSAPLRECCDRAS